MKFHSISLPLARALAVTALLFSAAAIGAAQAARPTPPDPGLPGVIHRADPDPMTSIEEEMRAKRAIRYAEKEYQENIERAHELADLGVQLSESYKKNPRLDRDAIKKLDRIEKLTKAIRSAAGGSDSEGEMEKHPGDLAASMKEMFEVVDSLARRVEKTPRKVVSAAVIDQANVLLELVRTVRQFSGKA